MEREPWFKRGWTLQELLAPPRILFFTEDWRRITQRGNDKDVGDTTSESPPLMTKISRITDIPIEELLHFEPGLQNIRQKMSWASQRQTERIEDKAYSLIGIFGLSIPIAYGEREMAFYRLQVEILQRSEDPGLFRWHGVASAYNSMLAVEPNCFGKISNAEDSADFEGKVVDYSLAVDDVPAYTLTNRGLQIWLMVYPSTDVLTELDLQNKELGVLGQIKDSQMYMAIVLQKIENQNSRRYRREALVSVAFHSSPQRKKEEIFIA